MTTLQWIFLKPEDLTDYLAHEQIQLLAEYSSEESKPLDHIIRDTCAYIQGQIPEKLHPCPMATNHLPASCKTAACYMIIEALQSRIPDIQLTEDQIRNAQQARQTLENLFANWRELSRYKNFAPRLETVHYRIREANYHSMKGL